MPKTPPRTMWKHPRPAVPNVKKFPLPHPDQVTVVRDVAGQAASSGEHKESV